MKKFNSCQVRTHAVIADTTTKKDDQQLSNQHLSTISIGNFNLNSEGISMPYKEAFANTKVPEVTAEGIWTKASMLTSEENAIFLAPGCGPKDKMVKSKSETVPHLVSRR